MLDIKDIISLPVSQQYLVLQNFHSGCCFHFNFSAVSKKETFAVH